MKDKGFTLLEMTVVIAIIAILAGMAMVRFTSTQRRNDMDMALNIVQSALIEARDKSSAPQPTTAINEASNINGYGMMVNLASGSNKQVILFKDSSTGGTLNQFDDEDEQLKTYSFSDSGINRVQILQFVRDGTIENGTINPHSIVFKYSEIPSQKLIYFDAVSIYNSVSTVLQHLDDATLTNPNQVSVDMKSGEIKIQ